MALAGQGQNLLREMVEPQTHRITEVARGFDDRLARRPPQLLDQRPVNGSVVADGADRVVIHQRQFEFLTAG